MSLIGACHITTRREDETETSPAAGCKFLQCPVLWTRQPFILLLILPRPPPFFSHSHTHSLSLSLSFLPSFFLTSFFPLFFSAPPYNLSFPGTPLPRSIHTKDKRKEEEQRSQEVKDNNGMRSLSAQTDDGAQELQRHAISNPQGEIAANGRRFRSELPGLLGRPVEDLTYRLMCCGLPPLALQRDGEEG